MEESISIQWVNFLADWSVYVLQSDPIYLSLVNSAKEFPSKQSTSLDLSSLEFLIGLGGKSSYSGIYTVLTKVVRIAGGVVNSTEPDQTDLPL